MKKILIFSTGYIPFIGGAEIAIKEITDRMEEGCHFDLITAKLSPSLATVERIGAITVYRLGFGIAMLDKLILPIWGAFKALRLNSRQNYDYFWGIMVTFASLAGYFANGILGLFGKRKVMVLTLQEGDSEEYLQNKWGGLIDLFWKFVLKRTDKLTAISNYLLDRAKKFGFSGSAVLVPNGVDLNVFKSIDEKGNIKSALGFEENDVILVTSSRLVEKNAVNDIVDSLKLLPDNIKLLIIGSGVLEKDLKSQVASLGFNNRVIFLGYVEHKKLPSYLGVSDIFIRPSLSEGMGNSFIEAMALGLPIIATPVGGIPDFLTDEVTGLFCEVRNPESIAEQVKRYLENPALREQIVLNAQNMAKEKYDWNIIVKQMKEKVVQ